VTLNGDHCDEAICTPHCGNAKLLHLYDSWEIEQIVQIFGRIARIPAAAIEPSFLLWGWVSGTSVSYNRTIHTGLKVPAVVRGGMLLSMFSKRSLEWMCGLEEQ